MDNEYLTDLTSFELLEAFYEPASGYGGGVQRTKEEYVQWMTSRTKKAAVAVINLMERTQTTPALSVVRFQLIKSSSSSAANYRAACRARSKNEFFSKMSIVVEETDETVYWLEVLKESDIKIDKGEVQDLHNEWLQLLKIMAKARSNIQR